MPLPLKMRLRDWIADKRGQGRVGPYAPKHLSRMLDLTHARNAIWSEPDPTIKAFLSYALTHTPHARAQIFQDAFVLWVLGEKRDGFYVEFGATNGADLSNTNMLDLQFGWQGILAEPARNWHSDLSANRPNARIENDCVWSETGAKLTFTEVAKGELSTLTDFAGSDEHAHRRRRQSQTYEVTTISLNDLLSRHNAPEGFDYLSVDTEGSELDILQHFDFARWQPKVVTVEHNYTPARAKLHDLFTQAGYTRVLEQVSSFDDWYLAPGVSLPV